MGDSLTELRVVCTTAGGLGGGGTRLANHVISPRFVGTSHRRPRQCVDTKGRIPNIEIVIHSQLFSISGGRLYSVRNLRTRHWVVTRNTRWFTLPSTLMKLVTGSARSRLLSIVSTSLRALSITLLYHAPPVGDALM